MAHEEKLGKEEFVVRAIKKLRGKYRGIHTVFSGFNEAFRQYFGEDPRPVTQEMTNKGIIELRPVKGGVMIYLKGEAPQAGGDALKKILKEGGGITVTRARNRSYSLRFGGGKEQVNESAAAQIPPRGDSRREDAAGPEGYPDSGSKLPRCRSGPELQDPP